MSGTPTFLALEKIRIDGGTQARVNLDEAYIADLADIIQEIGADNLRSRMVVFADGANIWLADGFHRYFAMKKLGIESAWTTRYDGTQQDAIWYSLSANKDHGLRRTNEDKRKAVETALRCSEFSTKSVRELAKHIGVSHGLVQTIKTEMSKVSTKYSEARTAPPPSTDEQAGAPTESADTPVSSDETPPAKPLPKDKVGNVITDPGVALVFEQAPAKFKEIRDLLADAGRLAADLASGVLGVQLRADQFDTYIKNAKTILKAAEPFAVCPYFPQCERGCKCCRGQKWITETMWNAVPPEIRNAA